MKVKNKNKLPFSYKYLLLGAFGITVFLVLQEYTDYLINQYEYPFSWFAVSVKTSVNFFLWVALAVILNRVSREFDFISKNKKPLFILKHIVISLLIALIHRVFTILLFDFIYFLVHGFIGDFFRVNNFVALGAGVFSSLIQYWVFIGIFISKLYYQKYLEKQKELSNAELNALKMQLHPHFLFNTLNSISSLIDLDNKAAQKMLSKLGFLMRSILEKKQNHTVELKEEIEYIKSYLSIEQIRFQDRLEIIYDIDEDTLNAKVPTLILQPLVENAIKHGIAPKTDSSWIRVSSKIVNEGVVNSEKLELTIEDNGVGFMNGKAKTKGTGIGIKNIKGRLGQLYGDAFKFELLSPKETGFKARIVTPFI